LCAGLVPTFQTCKGTKTAPRITYRSGSFRPLWDISSGFICAPDRRVVQTIMGPAYARRIEARAAAPAGMTPLRRLRGNEVDFDEECLWRHRRTRGVGLVALSAQAIHHSLCSRYQTIVLRNPLSKSFIRIHPSLLRSRPANQVTAVRDTL
jgi:hypothetical protein